MSIPETLKKRLRDKKIIPFVGAGVSLEVKSKETGDRLFPSWAQLLENATKKLEKEQKHNHASLVRSLLKIDKPDYLEAARRAREGLGAVWFDFLKEQLDHPREHAKDENLNLPKAVWELGSRLIITTNFDRVLHWTCPQRDDLCTWDMEAPAEQVTALRDGVQRPTIWHLHGYIDNAANLILTPDGYKRLYPETENIEIRYQAALKTLQSHLASHSFLFIGFSLDDIYFGQQLQSINEIFQGAPGPHYVLVREAERERVGNLNLPVEIITFSDFGQPLLDCLQELGKIAAEPQLSVNTPSTKPEATPRPTYDPRNPPFFVPYRAKGEQVIGREDAILAVREQLTKGRRTAIGQTAVFQGLGGLGKTQLAVEYAYRYRNEYPNGVIWLNADQNIDAQLTELAEKARWIAPESEHKYKLDVARQRLRTYSDCLIIFDNLEDRRAIESYLPEPQVEPHILVTSRVDQAGFMPIPINTLDEELSLKLLLQEAGREPVGEPEWEAAHKIAKTLGGLPLALELAGAYLQHRPISWQQYCELLQQNLKAGLPPKFLESFTKHEADLYSTLKINEKVFSEDPRLRDILDLLTWSGPSAMGLSLFCALLNVQNATELTNALGLGTALRLLQKTSDDRYAIHRLVSEVRREDIHLENRLEWVNSVCQRLGDWFQARKENFADLPQFEAEINHLRVWEEHALKLAPEHSSRLTWLQGYPPYHRGHYREAQEWVSRAWKKYEHVKGKDLALQANLLNDLGSTYLDLGDYQYAREYNEKALAIRQELFGERHSDTAASFNNIGMAYKYLGDYQRAREYHEKALAIQKDLFGERHPRTALAFNNIGTVYLSLGNFQQALEYHEKALTIQKDLFGERHPDTATSLNNLGNVYQALRDYQRACEYYEKALVIQKDLFGERHPNMATSLNNAGITYASQGARKRAVAHIQKALTLRRQLLGEQHPDTLNSVKNLANILNGFPAIKLLDEFLQKLSKDHSQYNSLKEQRQRIANSTPGLRKTSVKNQSDKGKKKKRR